MIAIQKEIRNCNICSAHLPFKPKPVIQLSQTSKILIIGQAPGLKVQQSGIAWDDKSGDELRRWLDVDKDTFYNSDIFALIPMGFCYPGKGKSGDLPPRPECAPAWHKKLLEEMPHIKLTLLVGLYAQRYYLKEQCYRTLSENVKNFQQFLPDYLPLVHPSPRNRIWQKRNPWFENELIPKLKTIVFNTLNS